MGRQNVGSPPTLEGHYNTQRKVRDFIAQSFCRSMVERFRSSLADRTLRKVFHCPALAPALFRLVQDQKGTGETRRLEADQGSHSPFTAVEEVGDGGKITSF
jgi:hypothetical protein